MMYRFKSIAVALLLVTGEVSFASGNLVDQIERCSQVDGSEARLSCYDEIAKGVSSLRKNADEPVHSQQSMPETDVAVAAQEQAPMVPPRQTAEEQFGFEQKQAAAAKEEVDRLYVDVTSVKKDRAGLSTIYLANGQVWRQTGTDRYFYREAQGKAYLERGSMSSFFFSQDEIKRRIRVKRLQ